MKEALLATINDEHATVEAFASLLVYEQKALTAASPADTLPDIIARKTELVERLASLEKQRDAQLAALGYAAGKAGIDAAAERDPGIASRWKLLRDATERARHANMNNGMLIRIRMDYNERTLQVLRAQPARAGLYGPDGRVSNPVR
ncbi:flagella synthesis protein FlgN [Burkholderia glumae]|uniref:Flagellar protein FlgN n=1 Tax=Burkholderia glumae TaxID=337 RepID=A0AAP9Y1M4_BURGL|nr:flagellar protein FlgN [Burkholderia glumae]ACR30382.1 flagella synthesis protein FlgN [Burkholderia glumae BGR1]AJY65957.1 flgN family protein [Burkholderia glumae LMG 2196 = ATCC 33617]KHJ64250.1 flagellar biosynthesis protein FlgN [Burkholderia glumae]MCM2481966.1 flagellar protein FlgN [Burkholderia glumae]MCM2491436.1 flagellar protein FlgN [Burkholderia glumae]